MSFKFNARQNSGVITTSMLKRSTPVSLVVFCCAMAGKSSRRHANTSSQRNSHILSWELFREAPPWSSPLGCENNALSLPLYVFRSVGFGGQCRLVTSEDPILISTIRPAIGSKTTRTPCNAHQSLIGISWLQKLQAAYVSTCWHGVAKNQQLNSVQQWNAMVRPPALGETTEMTLSPLAPKSLSFFRPFAVCAQRLGGTTRQKAAIRPSECFGNAAPIRGRIPASLRKEYHESRCVPHIHPNAIVKNVMQHRPWRGTFQLQVAKLSST